MSRLINWLIGGTIVSGLYVLVSESWSVAYRWNLILHPLVGIGATLALIWYAASHIRDKLKGEGDVSPARIALLIALPVGAVLLGHLLGELYWIPMVVIAALLIGPLRRIGRFVMKRLRHAPAVLLGGAALGLWIAGLTTGVPLFAFDGVTVTRAAIYSHRGFAIAAGAIYLAHLLFIRVYRAERTVTPETQGAKAELDSALRICAGLTVLLVATLAVEGALPRVRYAAELFRLPGNGHPAPFETPLEGADLHALEVADSCATSGCHESIVDDFQHSTHATAPRTPYFQRVLELMASERGDHDTLVCGGCHYPQALVTPVTDFRVYGRGEAEGFTCMSCHGVSEVSFDPEEKRRSNLVFEPNMEHLRMFFDVSGDESIEGLSLRMIQMNPLGHGRAMTPGPQHSQDLCLACHHTEIEPAATGNFEFPECKACHMQSPEMLDRPGTEKSHVFAGANTAVPFALGHMESLAITKGFLANDFELYIDKWGSAWALRGQGYGSEKHRALYLRMSAQIDGEPHPGEALELQISTLNAIEHAFPAAPFDLIEVWLHVKVTDANDVVLLESGALDERKRVDPAAQRLGGRVLNAAGEALQQHRIWEPHTKHLDAHIGPGETHRNHYSFEIPESGAALPLHVEARWMYRKINQDFIEWAYDRDDITMPITVVEAHESHWRPPTAQRDAGGSFGLD